MATEPVTVPEDLEAASRVAMLLALGFGNGDDALAYWQGVYDSELERAMGADDHDGRLAALQLWFGPQSVARILCALAAHGLHDDLKRPVLDLGCGNGHMTQALSAVGYTDVTGTDISPAAIDLAKWMRDHLQALEKEESAANFAVDDVLDSVLNDDHFGLVVDKGCLDCVAMLPREDEETNEFGVEHESSSNRSFVERYVQTVGGLLCSDGHLLLLSCSLSQMELEALFESTFDIITCDNPNDSEHGLSEPILMLLRKKKIN